MGKKRITHSKWNDYVKLTILEMYLNNADFGKLASIERELKKNLTQKYLKDPQFPRKCANKKSDNDAEKAITKVPTPSQNRISKILTALGFSDDAPYRLADELATLQLLLLAIKNPSTQVNYYREIRINIKALQVSYDDLAKILKDPKLEKSIHNWEIHNDIIIIRFYEKMDFSITNILELLLLADEKTS